MMALAITFLITVTVTIIAMAVLATVEKCQKRQYEHEFQCLLLDKVSGDDMQEHFEKMLAKIQNAAKN